MRGRSTDGAGNARRVGPEGARRVGVVAAATLVWGAILLAAAGRLDWPRGWAYLALYVLSLVVTGLVASRFNPGLIAERGRRHEGTKPFDKVFGALYTVVLFALPLVAGLDAVRFSWSALPVYAAVIGGVIHLLGLVPVIWSMAVNPHLETTVRIQLDRDHRVVDTGPYRFVRHPMYLGGILQFLAAPLILGSAWALVPAFLLVALMTARAALEDETLLAELPGYQDYAHQTRYRLVPGVW